jgi:hypothetical protein
MRASGAYPDRGDQPASVRTRGGDIDADDDEAVVTTPDGTVFVIDYASAFSDDAHQQTESCGRRNLSAPAVGDVDNDGTMEIACGRGVHVSARRTRGPCWSGRASFALNRRGSAESEDRARVREPVAARFERGQYPTFCPLDDGTLAAFDYRGRAVAVPARGTGGRRAAPSF